MNRTWTSITAIGVFILVALVVGLLYIYSGLYNVASTDELASISRWVLSTTTMKSIAAHSPDESPLPKSVPQDMLAEGAEHYGEMCVGCHGAPGQKPAWLAKGLTPKPPDLAQVVPQFSDGELYWIVKNGIKHTAMPAMGPTHSEKKIQGVVAFIKKLPDMSPQQYEAMAGGGGEEGGREHVGHDEQHGESSHEHSEGGHTDNESNREHQQ